MFTNLIESASHQKELARRGRFLLGTFISYALIVMCAGVVSIYAYDAHLENQNLEMLVLVAPTNAPDEPTVERATRPKTNGNPSDKEERLAVRTELIAQIATSTKAPNAVSNTASNVTEMPPGPFKIGTTNSNGNSSGPYDPNMVPGIGGPGVPSNPGGPVVDVTEIGTPPPVVKRDPPKNKPVISKGVINGQAISKPNPAYPPLALKARAQGIVSVQLLVDETGRVISAKATSGHPLLRQAAEQAARNTRFSPTLLSGEAVKVSGTITFNFTLNQ